MGLAPQVERFFDLIASSFSREDLSRIQDAWAVAESAHSGQVRQSGEPYASHPLAVASILFECLGADVDALCAALLHDVVEDTEVNVADIESHFGPVVARIVDGVSKLDCVRTSGSTSAKEATLRKLVAAGGRDWRVFAVKLCDRLHNMRTLDAVGRSKMRRVALETYQIFFPLARYVGFAGIANELQALSLRALHPWRWAVIAKWCAYKAKFDDRRLSTVLPESMQSWRVDAAGQVGGDRRIVDSVIVAAFLLLREDRAARALFSVPAVHVLRTSIDEAYRQLAELHFQFHFIPGSFRIDSSQGVVASKVMMSRRGMVVEFKFWFARSPQAPLGLGLSGDFGAGGDDFVAVAETGDVTGDFTRVLRDLVNQDSIQVFSPKGKRLSLPRHSTGLDFAFAIHSDIGLRALSVRINGVDRACRTELVSGDIVEVLTGDSIVARPEWSAQLRSPRSRAKLRAWLRESARLEALAFGRRLLSGVAGGFDFDDFCRSPGAGDVFKFFDVTNGDELLRLVGSGQLSPYAVLTKCQGLEMHGVILGAVGMDARRQLLLDGTRSDGLRYCEKCMPLPGDVVVASSSYSGAVVHRSDCGLMTRGRSSSDHFVPVWADRMKEALPVIVSVEALDRKGLLADCARVIADTNVNVSEVLTASFVDERASSRADLRFTIRVKSAATLERCMLALRGVSGVLDVQRGLRPDAAPRSG